jgi:uncharacterized protein
MKSIILGGTGLIGSELVRSLAIDGDEVVILSRNPDRHTGDLPQGARLHAWDGRTIRGWSHLVEDADAIVNLAGSNLATIWTAEKKRQFADSRFLAGAAVTEAVRRAAHKPRVVVQASAVGYYGPRGEEIITEDSDPGDDFLAQLCQQWEASTAEVEQFGVRRVILRIGLPLDRKGGVLPKFLLPFRMFAGGPIGSGRQYLPWLHMQDQVSAMRFLMENDAASGPYNLSAPYPVSNREFVRTLGQVLQRPAVLPAPSFAVRLVLGEMSTVVLTGQRVIPSRLQAAGYQFTFTRLEEALRDLLQPA